MIDVERVTQNGFGLFGSLKRLGATAISILENRLELIIAEWQEEKARTTSLLISAAATIFLALLSIVALMFLLTFIFWEERVVVMGGFCAFFVIGTLISFILLKSKLKAPPFAETLTQLRKDAKWLRRG